MIWRSIKYDWPEAAALVFLVLILIWSLVFLHSYRKQKLKNLADARLLEAIMEPRLRFSFWTKAFLICLAWICGVLALMQPKGNEQYVTPQEQASPPSKNVFRQQAHDVIFLIDASASMSITDTRTGKSRLDQSKGIADEIVSRLSGENVALHAFTTATMQMVPLTPDYLFMRLMLRQISINEGETEGTALLQAFETMRKLYFDTPTMKRKTLILLTDGDDTHLESLKGNEREQFIAKLIHSVEDAEAQYLRVFTIGIGSIQGKDIPGIKYQGHPVVSALNEKLLRKLANMGNGEAYFDRDAATIQIADAIADSIAGVPPFYEEKAASRIQGREKEFLYDYYFQIPLGISIIALALSILAPQTLRRKNKRDAF